MNNRFQYIVNTFIKDIDENKIIVSEKYNEVKIKIETSQLIYPSENDFWAIIDCNINKRDKLHISIEFENNERINFSTKDSTITFLEFVQSYSETYLQYQNSIVNIELTITKKQIGNIYSIYSLTDFINSLENLSFSGVLYVFNEAFNNNLITFECLCDSINFQTKTISFINNLNENETTELTNRIANYDKVKSLGDSSLFYKYKFTPDDFHVIKNINGFDKLDSLFKKVELLYSFLFLFDSLIITDSLVEYKLKAYKTASGNFNIKDVNPLSSNTFYEIYNWVFCGGNLNDKIGIARNIISLHFVLQSLYIPESTLNSIHSSFQIYETQNIKQYIEIRNKITDQLIEFRNKADKIVEVFANDFKKSLLAFITFFASVIVISVLRSGDFLAVFTVDVMVLSYSFLAVMLIFFFASKWELKKQKERFNEIYNNTKERYIDLLEIEDINKILNNDKDFKSDINFIQKKSFVYSLVWVGIICLFSVSIFILYLYASFYKCLNCSIIKKIMLLLCS